MGFCTFFSSATGERRKMVVVSFATLGNKRRTAFVMGGMRLDQDLRDDIVSGKDDSRIFVLALGGTWRLWKTTIPLSGEAKTSISRYIELAILVVDYSCSRNINLIANPRLLPLAYFPLSQPLHTDTTIEFEGNTHQSYSRSINPPASSQPSCTPQTYLQFTFKPRIHQFVTSHSSL